MNKIARRLLSLACCAAMLLGSLPNVSAAAPETPVAENEIRVVEEVSPGVYVKHNTQEAPDSEALLSPISTFSLTRNTTLPKLATPTNLEWGVYREEWLDAPIPVPGMISWQPHEPTLSKAKIEIYRVGEAEPVHKMNWNFGSQSLPEWRSIEDFVMGPAHNTPDFPSSPNFESGTYYFTVTARGDNVNYADSDTAVSDTWTYVKPSTQLAPCTNLSWNWPEISYTPPTDTTYVGGYEVAYCYAATLSDEPECIGSSWDYDGIGNADLFEHGVDDWDLQEYGTGYYYFSVRPLSSDITVTCNGNWSALSPAFNVTQVTSAVENELEDVLEEAEYMDDDEIRDAVQSMDTDDLKTAMLTDQDGTGALAQIAQLENLVGGSAGIEVSQDAQAFDPSKVSIIGANLNNAASATDPITLVIDKPEEDHVLDAAYNNSVAVKFSMDLNNVEDSQNLAVPVMITLPIPATINPEFLVLLHYHADGSREELTQSDVYTYQEGGQWYVSFALTSFSDFVLTQLQTVETTPMHRLYNPNSGEHFYTGSIVERDNLVAAGWNYEGIAWNAPTNSGAPVHRLYNPNSGDHHYTMSAEEKDMLVSVGWIYEGVCWNSAPTDHPDSMYLYRLFNPNADCGSHHYTGSEEEKNMLVSAGWIYEGIGWFGMVR